MFERFTDKARQAVVLAQEEARMMKHNYIGTEHLLLALSHPDVGMTTQPALEAVGLSHDRIREIVLGIIREGDTPPMGHIPFTPRHRKVLEGALREALRRGNDYISPDHLLLSLVNRHLGDGVAGSILMEVTPDGAPTPLIYSESGRWHKWEDRPQAGKPVELPETAAPKHAKVSLEEFKNKMARTVYTASQDQLMLAAHALGFPLEEVMAVDWKGRIIDAR